MKTPLALVVLCLSAGLALAHNGVKNAEVMARMEAMTTLAQNTKTLADMAGGKTPYNAQAAAQAKIALATGSAAIPSDFKDPAQDPKSEALPAIWEDWRGFTDNAKALTLVIAGLDVSSRDGLQTGVARIGRACSSCHKGFRKEK